MCEIVGFASLPTRANAHPHVADDGSLALVHNGIIENYAALRAGLEKRGCEIDHPRNLAKSVTVE